MMVRRSNQFFSLASPAKLNLFLEITGRRDDGFHELDTVMVPFPLYDGLTFTPIREDRIELSVHCRRGVSAADVPCDRRNLVWQAVEIVRQISGQARGMAIQLYKRIPVQAGLGGASGNAAATLLAVNCLWKLNWSRSRLAEIANRIGSDVAFFLGNGLARCTGTGTDVQNLNYRCCLYVVAVNPPFGLSTGGIYARCRVPDQPIGSNALLAGLKSGRVTRIGKSLFNRLQRPASSAHQGIAQISEAFATTHCVGHQLTGSGSCYFGIYRNRRAMTAAARILANRLPGCEIFAGQSSGSRKD